MSGSTETWGRIRSFVKENIKEKLAERDNGWICKTCTRNFSQDPFILTVDHIEPISKGGKISDLTNMQLLCWTCHRNKSLVESGMKTPDEVKLLPDIALIKFERRQERLKEKYEQELLRHKEKLLKRGLRL